MLGGVDFGKSAAVAEVGRRSRDPRTAGAAAVGRRPAGHEQGGAGAGGRCRVGALGPVVFIPVERLLRRRRKDQAGRHRVGNYFSRVDNSPRPVSVISLFIYFLIEFIFSRLLSSLFSVKRDLKKT